MKNLHMVTFILVIVGALNWGVVGLTSGTTNIVHMVLGSTGLENIVYILVGVSAVVLATTHMGDCKMCSSKK